MSYGKPDFPGLLPEGLHPMTLAGIRKLCVDRFPASDSRNPLMESLEDILHRLDQSGIPADIWIDGSFITQKINPNDVDLVVLIPGRVYNGGSPEVREVIHWVGGDEISETHKIDSYVVPFFPDGDPMRPLTDAGVKHWLNLFGSGRDPQFKKGIPVLKVRGGAK